MPAYCTDINKDGSTIAIWDLTETEDELAALCLLPSSEQEEMQYITNPQRRKERLAVYVLLKHLFGEKVYLGYHDNGRPFLQNQDGHISISHTQRFVCILYHPEEYVGIDIENTTRDFSAVEKKALSAEEQHYLGAKNRAVQLCLIWCAKEALFKWASESGVDFANQLAVEEFTPREKGKLTAHFTNRNDETTEFRLHYRMVEDHAMVWVVA